MNIVHKLFAFLTCGLCGHTGTYSDEHGFIRCGKCKNYIPHNKN